MSAAVSNSYLNRLDSLKTCETLFIMLKIERKVVCVRDGEILNTYLNKGV